MFPVLEVGKSYRVASILILEKLINTKRYIYWPRWYPFKVYDMKEVQGMKYYKVGRLSAEDKANKTCGWLKSAVLQQCVQEVSNGTSA